MQDQTITHHKYGSGFVKQSRNSGFELLVEFKDGFSRWVRYDEITNCENEKPNSTVADQLQINKPDGTFSSRRMIEAFRLGIVPYDQVGDFTFGRDKELHQIKKWLESDSDNSLFMVGEYGTGKTHMLSYLREFALKNGYAVASVEMDGSESSFSKPNLVYRHLARSFSYIPKGKKDKLGFREFVSAVLMKGMLTDHQYFGVLKHHKEFDAWDWIMGEPSQFYYGRRMLDNMKAANVYCNVLSGLGWAANEALGLNGLILLFDEAESIQDIYSPYQWEKAENFIQALVRTANNDKKLLEGSFRQSGLVYTRYALDIPFLYKNVSNIKLVFGFTPGYYVDSLKRDLSGIESINLSSLSRNVLYKAFEEIHSLYEKSYPHFISLPSYDLIEAQIKAPNFNMRRFVKAVVESSDIARFRNKN